MVLYLTLILVYHNINIKEYSQFSIQMPAKLVFGWKILKISEFLAY
ncbi:MULTISPECIES: hypothetical protein [Planktothrix]|nr:MULTISPECIES: hypothetical protein [Planktothrix]